MKKVIIKRTKKQLIKESLNKSFYALVFFVIVLALGFVNRASYRKGFTEVEGVIEKVEVKENSYKVKLVDNDRTYEFFDQKKQLGDGKSAEGQTIVFQIFPSLSQSTIVSVKVNDMVVIDTSNQFLKRATIFSVILFSLSTILFGIFVFNLVRFLRKPLVEEKDYVEMMLTKEKIITNQMFDTTFKVNKITKVFVTIRYVIYLILMVHILMALIFVMAHKDELLIGIIVLVVIVLLLILPFLHPLFYSKQSKIFKDDYLRYLKEGSLTKYYDSPFTFKKEGLKFEKDGNVIFNDYHEVNLYTVALYSRGIHAVNIFIASDQNIESELDERVEYIIPLTHKNYQEIKDNNIEIRGLEYLLDNLEEEIKINNKKPYPKYKIKKYF